MARGGKRGNPYRDANGRFASASAGRSGLGASRSKSSPAAARKAARSQSGRASTLSARTSLKKSRAKLAAKDPADQRLSSTLSGRAQKAAVTRGNRKLAAAKGAAKTKLQGAATVGTISKNRPKVATARPINQSARIPAAQRPGSMANILGGTLKALAQADAQRIREIEAITGQKVRVPRKSAGTPSVATVRPAGRRSVSATLGDNLRQLAQSDARMMRGMAEIARDATPKIGGGRKKAIKGASKALPQGGGVEKLAPSPKIDTKQAIAKATQLRQRANRLSRQAESMMSGGRKDNAIVNAPLSSKSRSSGINQGIKGSQLAAQAKALNNKADRILDRAIQSRKKAEKEALKPAKKQRSPESLRISRAKQIEKRRAINISNPAGQTESGAAILAANAAKTQSRALQFYKNQSKLLGSRSKPAKAAPKPPSRAKGSRTRLPGMTGVIGKPKGLKPGALAERPPRVIGKPLGGESKRIASTPIKRSGAMKPPITLSRLKEIGGNRWQKNNMDRVYFNNLAGRAGMDYSKYKSSGRVSTAALKGKGISNSKAQEIIANLNAGKVYFDRKTRKMVAQGPSMSYGRSRQQTTAKGLLDEVARKLERQGRVRTIKRANQKRKKSK